MTHSEQSAIREVGQAAGWRVRAKQGGWEWDAWCQTSHRCGAARTEASAKSKATAALAELQSERRCRS